MSKELKQIKKDFKKLIKLIEHNTHNLWDSNLQDTSDCILLEDKELKDMVYEEDIEEKDFKNHKFTGSQLLKLIAKIETDLNTLSELKEKSDNLDKVNDILWEFIWEKDYDNIQLRLEEEGL
tara:strand:+ start:38 stop:403 length:366 start_codon:yes stop_codon:yes gene_type:complete